MRTVSSKPVYLATLAPRPSLDQPRGVKKMEVGAWGSYAPELHEHKVVVKEGGLLQHVGLDAADKVRLALLERL